MSLYWLLFATLSVIGSVVFNVGTKLGSHNADVFGFTLLVNVIVLALLVPVCAAAKYGFDADLARGLDAHTIKYAILTACGIVLIDVSFFLAIRYGSAVSSQVFWAVGGMLAFAVYAVLFFGETMSLTKIAGIVLGIASVFLITKAA